MQQIHTQHTTLAADVLIGEAARDYPALLAIFDSLGIDYCCHGRDTVERACERAGVDPGVLGHAIHRQVPPADAGDARVWSSMTMTQLCDDIEATHHLLVRATFERLAVLMPRVVSSHASSYPRLLELNAVILNLREEMIDHLVREERVLFPWLRRLEAPHALLTGPPWSVRRPIDCMIHDHDQVGNALASIKMLTDGHTPPSGTCTSVVSVMSLLAGLDRDTKVHIHKENNILFPAGVRAERDRKAAQAGHRGGTT